MVIIVLGCAAKLAQIAYEKAKKENQRHEIIQPVEGSSGLHADKGKPDWWDPSSERPSSASASADAPAQEQKQQQPQPLSSSPLPSPTHSHTSSSASSTHHHVSPDDGDGDGDGDVDVEQPSSHALPPVLDSEEILLSPACSTPDAPTSDGSFNAKLSTRPTTSPRSIHVPSPRSTVPVSVSALPATTTRKVYPRPSRPHPAPTTTASNPASNPASSSPNNLSSLKSVGSMRRPPRPSQSPPSLPPFLLPTTCMAAPGALKKRSSRGPRPQN